MFQGRSVRNFYYIRLSFCKLYEMGVLFELLIQDLQKVVHIQIMIESVKAVYVTVFPAPALKSTEGRLLGGPVGLRNSLKSVEELFGRFRGSPRFVKSTEGRLEN
jgi:hypothetical protein